MNIYQFENIFYTLFSSNKRLVSLSAKINVELNDDEIIAYDGNKKVGFMNFIVDNDLKFIRVQLVQVQEEYKSKNVALKIFKKFHSLYKEKYWGYEIYASFYNHDLSDFFDSAISKGWFPEGINKTEKVDVEQETKMSFEDWSKDSDESNFGINRIVDLNEMPEPFWRSVNQEKSNFFGGDVVYKNLTESELNILNENAYKFFKIEQQLNTVQADGVDIYYSFSSLINSPRFLGEISPQILAYHDYYSGEPEVVTTDLSLIEQNSNSIVNFLGVDNALILLSDENPIANIANARELGESSIIDLNSLKEYQKSAALKSRLKKGGNR